MKRKILVLICLIVFSGIATSQTTDLARIEYLNLPFSNSDNSIQRYRALVQIPIPINLEEKKFFVVGLEYRHVDINIEDAEDKAVFLTPIGSTGTFQNNMVNSVDRLDGYIGYTYKMSPSWRFGAKVGASIQSDLQNSIVSDDFIYEVGAYIIKDNDVEVEKGNSSKPYRLILGLVYSTTPGRNFPLPLINYHREFHPNWNFTLGVPKTLIRHFLNDDHKDALQAFATLDNFFGNIQNNFAVDDKTAENISMTVGLTGIGYEHYFTKHLYLYVYGAHSVYTDFRLRDGNGDNVYTINDENSLYLRTGLKFKF